MLLPAWGPQETGYWNPAVETGPEGKATVTFSVPDRTTSWTLLGKGITTDTLAGEGTADLVVKKDLFGELKLPLAFTDGDRAEVLASVHNDAVEQGTLEVTLKTTIDGRSVEEKKTVAVTSKGIHELSFAVSLERPKSSEDDKAEGTLGEVAAAFELTVAAGELRDVLRRSVPLLPDGIPVFGAASGSATSDATAWVEAPADMPVEAPYLQILVGPTVERSLLDIVLGPAPVCQIEVGRIASGLDSATSDLLASLGLEKLLSVRARSRWPGGPGSGRPSAGEREPLDLLAKRGRRLELDRPRADQRPLRLGPGRVGAEPCPRGRIHGGRRWFHQGARLPPQPAGGGGLRRLREPGHPAARAGRGGAR